MSTLTLIFDQDGESYLDFKSTINFAIDLAEMAGFETTGRSNVSEATYLQRPDCAARLRIAAHGGQRDQVVAACTFPKERKIIDGEFETVVPLQPHEAFAAVKAAIAEYDAFAAREMAR